MRTLRVVVAGIAFIVLLVGSGATAAEDEAETPVVGSALLDFTTDIGGWTRPSVTVEEGRNAYRDLRRVIDPFDPGDPRLSGRLWMIQHHDVFHDSRGNVAVGIAGIELDDGVWRGTFAGYGAPGFGIEAQSSLRVDLTGEGAYEGFSAMLFLNYDEEAASGARWGSYDVEGIVFPGDLPPMPDMPTE